ncbi:hypothetical protein ABIC60_004572 [Phyllobacterium ifriqiyense]
MLCLQPWRNGCLNALFKYSWVYDLPGEDQVSVITGDNYGPAQGTTSSRPTLPMIYFLAVCGAK